MERSAPVRRLLPVVLVAVIAVAPDARAQAPDGFSRTVGPIFEARCSSCHGASKAEAGLRLDSWEGALAGSSFGEAFIPFDAGRSLAVRLVSGQGPFDAHPTDVGAPALSDEEFEALQRWVAEGARDDAGKVAFEGDRDFVYACNQGEASVSVVDAQTGVVARVVDLVKLGFAANAKPHHVVVEPDGSAWYVSLIGANRVLKFNRDNEIVGSVETPYPGLMALDGVQDYLYVGRSMTAVNPPQSVARIRRSDMTLVEDIEVFMPRPHAIALSPDGRTLYSASLAENRAIAVDIETADATFLSLEGPIHTTVQFAVSPADGTVLGGGQLTGALFVIDPPTGDAPARVRQTMPGPLGPWHPVFDAAGERVYVPSKTRNLVTVYDPATWESVAVLTGSGLADPHGSALSADGRFLFVSNTNMHGAWTPRYDFGPREDFSGMDKMPGMHGAATRPGTLVKIDLATGTIVRAIEIGMSPSGIGSRGASAKR